MKPEYAWTDLGNGRRVYRRITPIEQRGIAPYAIGDTIDPVRSAADGRVYDSKSRLRATYKPNGNPQGASFLEVGNEYRNKEYKPPKIKPDMNGITAAVERAKSRLGL